LKKIWQLEDILLLLVLNRKTSNVNTESWNRGKTIEGGEILSPKILYFWDALIGCCQIYIILGYFLDLGEWKMENWPSTSNGMN